MDDKCIKLCSVINKIKGLRTIESCCGHGKETFKIWFKADDLILLPILLYYISPCHIGFKWDVFVTTDCAMSPVTFCLESREKGKVVYEQAEKIACRIESFLKENKDE